MPGLQPMRCLCWPVCILSILPRVAGPIADVLSAFSGYAQPFQLPTQGQILRFRYTTYMGEKHPSECKVVMEFTTKDLGLEPVSRRKLIKLAGARYNPEKDLVHMSCEMFETQAQNKRYLSDLLDKLLVVAKVTGVLMLGYI